MGPLLFVRGMPTLSRELPRSPVSEGMGHHPAAHGARRCRLIRLPAAARQAAGGPRDKPGLRFGEPEPFSFELLIERAKAMAAQPYVRRRSRRPTWSGGSTTTRTASCTSGQNTRCSPTARASTRSPSSSSAASSRRPCGCTWSRAARRARSSTRRTTSPSADDSPARELPPGTNAFAGFWIQESRLQGDWRKREPWATFLGASYFRAVGEQGQVGMSARGLALNVASSTPEEFPDFVAHWISPAMCETVRQWWSIPGAWGRSGACRRCCLPHRPYRAPTVR